jgi:hypothetical protein
MRRAPQARLPTEMSFQCSRESAPGLTGSRCIPLKADIHKKGEQRSPEKNGRYKVRLGSVTKLDLQIVKAGSRFFHLCFQLGAISQ